MDQFTVGDFASDTEVETLSVEGHYRAHLKQRWETWGPNGGYLAAIALRAAGQMAAPRLPTSIYCQFLNMANFDEVELQVTVLKQNRVAMALDVVMTQGGKCILKAQAWFSADLPGYEHDHFPRPSTWRDHNECELDEVVHYGVAFWKNFSKKTLTKMAFEDEGVGEPHMASWFRLNPDCDFSDPCVDAGRSLVLIDTLQWPSVFRAYGTGANFVAPSLDLAVNFHRPSTGSPWLFCDARGDTAGRGLIGGHGSVWDENGELVASGRSQMLCRKIA